VDQEDISNVQYAAARLAVSNNARNKQHGNVKLANEQQQQCHVWVVCEIWNDYNEKTAANSLIIKYIMLSAPVLDS